MAKLDQNSSGSVFADRGALTARGTEWGVPERASEQDALESVLAPSRSGRRSVGVALYGPTGSGKTELTYQAGRGFDRSGGTHVHLECRIEDTTFGCCRRLANDLGAELPESGVALETARERAIQRVRDAVAPRCVILDDIDRLGADVRRQLLMDVVGELDETTLAVVAASRSLTLRNELSARELATLSDSERVLDAYDESQLRSIFERRVERAFTDGAVGETLIDGAIEAALERDGDVGYGLELLDAAAAIAIEDGEPPVTRGHLIRARERVAIEAVADRIAGLGDHHALVLRGLCDLAGSGETPARVGSVFGRYVDACEAAGRSPNTKRSLQNYVRRLVEVGLVDREEVRTHSGGKFNRYDLSRSRSVVTAALDASE